MNCSRLTGMTRLFRGVMSNLATVGVLGCHTHFEARRFREAISPVWKNIHGRGDQRKSKILAAEWLDPEPLLADHPGGLSSPASAPAAPVETGDRLAARRAPRARPPTGGRSRKYRKPAWPRLVLRGRTARHRCRSVARRATLAEASPDWVGAWAEDDCTDDRD